MERSAMGEKVGKKGAKGDVPVGLKVRLFVGGLGPGVVGSDLHQRFAPLGTVHGIELVEGRKGWDPEGIAQRGFAYVDFEASSEASLRKLFSAYNGCKWKGGVLRVETAKERYNDRLRREWAEAEAEAAAKVKVAEKVAAAMAVAPARDMYSYIPDNEGALQISRSPERSMIGLEQDGMAGDADAAQIEKERRGHLDLLSKLFPEDKDAEDNEEEIVEIVKLRAYPMPDANAKKRKQALKDSPQSVPVASSSAQVKEDESGVARASKSPGALDANDKQRTKTRRVKFSEEADKHAVESMDGEKVGMKKGASDATKGVRPILKNSKDDSKKMDVAEDGNVEEEEEEEYSLSSRSPSPEGGLSDESKWERLFKYAGMKQGPEVSMPSAGVYTGIHLDDDDDEEPPAAVVETPPRDGDGMFSGVLSEEEDDETSSPEQNTLGRKATDSIVSKKVKKKTPVETPQRDGVGSDGIFSGLLSDSEEDEEENQPHPSTLGSEVQESVAFNLAEKFTEEPELSSDTLSSDYEDVSDDLQDTESGDSEMDEEDDEEDDEDEDMADFVGASSSLQSLGPTPLSEAARASKWAKMFKSATSAAGQPVDGAFSGSLDEVDVPVRARSAVKEQGMFESATANHTQIVSEAPTTSDMVVASEMDEVAIRQSSGEEDPGTSSEEDVKTENKGVTDATDDEVEGADDEKQTGTIGNGNLLARFNLAQDEVNPSTSERTDGAQSSVALQQDGAGVGVSNSPPQSEGQTAVDENTKWMQRASWKSLMGADGRVAFSLKQVTKDSEASTDVKKSETVAEPEQRIDAFSFNFARNTIEGTSSGVTSINSKPTEKVPNQVHPSSDSALVKNVKPAKVSDDEAGCSFMKSADADKEWRASKNELRIDSKAKHKAAVRRMKKMKGSGGAR